MLHKVVNLYANMICLKLFNLLGAKCYHITLGPTFDWLILKSYSKVILSNLVEVGTLSFCFKDNKCIDAALWCQFENDST